VIVSGFLSALTDFDGTARLFPLPGLVLFPQAMQPLHIFEPRYRALTADALSGDRLMTVVLLRDGWEEHYDEQPAVHRVACLGQIVADVLLPDGRYNLMLRGLARVRILDEPPTDRLYRVARVEILHDVVPDDVDELMTLRTALADLILPRVTTGPIREQVQALFHGELPLGQVCDLLAFALPLSPEVKQDLLECTDVPERARRLMEAFRALAGVVKPTGAGSGKRFPPDFSDN
jgi:Lon protease-like protein